MHSFTFVPLNMMPVKKLTNEMIIFSFEFVPKSEISFRDDLREKLIFFQMYGSKRLRSDDGIIIKKLSSIDKVLK
jgi:hypothetical protein